MIPSDQAPPGPDWLVRRVVDLERQVRELQAGRRLEAATIGAGGLTIKGGHLIAEYANGVEALFVGQFMLSDGHSARGVLMSRPGGELALWVYGKDDGSGGFFGVYDKAGNVIVSDDGMSGQGLARPWLPYTARPTSDYFTAPVSTTSATFTPMWTIAGEKQHPLIRVVVITQSDAGTTGEVRLIDTNTSAVIAGPQTIGAADNSWRTMDGSVSGGFSDIIKVDVELRRTGGTGNVRALVVYAMGRQS